MAGTSIVLCLTLLAQYDPDLATGNLGGRVVNSTSQGTPEAGAEVFLQVMSDGKFEVIGKAITSPEGRFLFEGIPLDETRVYRPGASHDEIFYPGPRVALGLDRPHADVVIEVRETSSGPSPLVVRGHDIVIEQEPGALRVTESMRIENPEPVTFVGESSPDDSDPITLELRIPAEFERITFYEEFYGRQFTMRDDRLVTSIPWTPGERQLTFTYLVPDEGTPRVWERRLELPCDRVRISVEGPEAESWTCSLGASTSGPEGNFLFLSDSRPLPAGGAITLDRPRRLLPVMSYARWIVVAALGLAMAATWGVMIRRRSSRPTAPVRGPIGKRAARRKTRAR